MRELLRKELLKASELSLAYHLGVWWHRHTVRTPYAHRVQESCAWLMR